MVAALGLLTSCDPSKDSISMPGNSDLTGEQLASGFSVEQFADEDYTTPAADGNYFKFTTSPSRVVRIYQKDDEGAENVLAAGTANGKFKIVPKRGNPNEQTFYIETRDFNGNIITAQKSATVYVPQELDPVVRLLASDAYGSKTWYWGENIPWDNNGTMVYGSWGNFGYTNDNGGNFPSGIWWSCPAAELTGQLNHSDTGAATGEEDPNAYMTFDWATGNVKSYDASGNQIRSGKFTLNYSENRNEVNGVAWNFGTLDTDAGSILFPFKINGGGTKPTSFQIIKLTNDQLILTYADEGTGSWSEATFWSFKAK